MQKNSLVLTLLGTVFIGVSTAAIAADTVSEVEKNRICNIAQDGMAEVKLGKLAETKGSSSKVKSFGKKMVTDHTLANNKLKAAAATSKVSLPADVNDTQKAKYAELSKLSGIEFDRKYVAEMVGGHDKAVSAIGDEAKEGTGALKQWAVKTMPTIKTHDELAKQLDTDVEKK